MTEARDTMLTESDAINSSSSENTPKHEKKFIRLPRPLVINLHTARYDDTGTSYKACLALAMILAKLTPLRYTDKNPRVHIRLRDLRKEWKVYGCDVTALRKLVEMLTELNNKSPLAGWVYADETHISVLYQWVTHVTVPTDYVPEGWDISKIKLPPPPSITNYIRVPIALIPMIKTHFPAIDIVLYAVSKNIRPHTYLLPKSRRNMKKAKLQKMIDEVVAVINRDKQADTLRRQNAGGSGVKQSTQPARQDQPAQTAQPAQPAPQAPSDTQHGGGGTTGV